ncbi:MAG: RNA polymerase sigma factor, partial [Bacteroidota bacterium]
AITYNHCMSYLRKRKRQPQDQPLEDSLPVADSAEATLNAKLVKELQLEQLEKALEELRPEERLVLNMYYQDGLSVRQISQVLGIGESGVKMRLLRSRNKLGERCKNRRHE